MADNKNQESNWEKELRELSKKSLNELIAELLMEMRFFNLNFTNISEDQLDLHDEWEIYNKRHPKAQLSYGEYKRKIQQIQNQEDLKELANADISDDDYSDDSDSQTSLNSSEEKYKS